MTLSFFQSALVNRRPVLFKTAKAHSKRAGLSVTRTKAVQAVLRKVEGA